MFHIILYRPEIPPNTGSVIRLCANTGSRLHLVEPLGFTLEEPRLRRAGLDYHEYARVEVHATLEAALAAAAPARLFAFTTRAETSLAEARFARGDALLFGPETAGLPETLLAALPVAARLRIPMLAHSRSLNLANAVAVAVYEGWRQLGYAGAAPQRDPG